eukprot:6195561-Pleurochrysis_carterae.AAC.1
MKLACMIGNRSRRAMTRKLWTTKLAWIVMCCISAVLFKRNVKRNKGTTCKEERNTRNERETREERRTRRLREQRRRTWTRIKHWRAARKLRYDGKDRRKYIHKVRAPIGWLKKRIRRYQEGGGGSEQQRKATAPKESTGGKRRIAQGGSREELPCGTGER